MNDPMNEPRRDDLQFRHLTTLLRRRWRLITAAALCGGEIALGIGMTIPPRFTARAQILVDQGNAATTVGREGSTVDTHVELLMSPSHLRRVLKSFAEDADAGITVLDDRTELPDGDEEDPPADDETLLDVEILEEKLNVYKEKQSEVVAVTYTSTEPDLAAIIANRVAELYVDRAVLAARAERSRIEAGLAERIAAARDEVDRAERALREGRASYGYMESVDADGIDRQIAELRHQLALAQSELAQRKARLKDIEGHLLSDDGLSAVIDDLQDPRLSETYASYITQIQAQGVKPGALPVSADASVHRDRVVQIAREAVRRLALDQDAVESRMQWILDRLATAERTREDAHIAVSGLSELERAAASALEVYNGLLRRKAELPSHDAVRPDARMVSAATSPEFPSSPSPLLFVLPAVVAFALFGGLSGAVLERLDRRLRSERDVEAALGIPCIGLIPQTGRRIDRAAQHRLIDHPFAPYTEAIRSVVTTSMMWLSHDAKIYLVTSSQQREGRTTLALSFAVYAAQLKRRVLIADLDFRDAGLAGALGRHDESGLTEIIKGVPVEQVIKSIPELGIDYLPLSSQRINPLVVLSTDWLPTLLEQLSAQYDCIVIDSGPLLGATEARLFAALAHKVIFAVKWGEIDPEVAQGALHQLRHAGMDKMPEYLISVLTQVDMRKHIFGRYGEIDHPSHLAAPPRQ